MVIRRTTSKDLNRVMAIYERARRFMQQTGNGRQWVNGYPSLALIKEDIENGYSYVLEDGGIICCVFYFRQGIEPTYVKIYQGQWLKDAPYGVVHRIASSGEKKGAASYCLNWCLSQCRSLRIDTHRDNIVMQNLLRKNGFTRCGIIYLEDGDERIAYERDVD